jgi:hypothetical protein
MEEKVLDADFKIHSYRKTDRTEMLYVRLPKELAARFRQLADEESVPISELLGQMVTFCLERYKK